MDMTTTPFGTTGAGGGATLAGAGRASFGQASVSAMSMRWSALHDAAGAVALLAGQAVEVMTTAQRSFPVIMRDTGGWRRNLAEQGVDDLAAIMEPGLAALLAVRARGADCTPAAGALWREFVMARDHLMSLVPAEGSPRRSA
jgi:hypothetical protein